MVPLPLAVSLLFTSSVFVAAKSILPVTSVISELMVIFEPSIFTVPTLLTKPLSPTSPLLPAFTVNVSLPAKPVIALLIVTIPLLLLIFVLFFKVIFDAIRSIFAKLSILVNANEPLAALTVKL